ncbi:DUF1178 family protein [Algicella marina]|uniref:DUF1178 family protein n=1 Tax=Algicella marina TaxID=2683284 RepID=A0A6P1T1G0_9RHOB|nr:DUF1178 family protein [Algicella marina]QHQ35650.1 DUF1178 family protein [Algicella marina]
MIRFALKCKQGHQFESWFGSGADYDRLAAAGHVSCIVCGESSVEKDIMAPRVASSGTDPQKGDAASKEPDAARPLSAPASPAEAALRKLRTEIEKNSENVGRNFAAEARAIHNGEAPERAIIGEARADEARDLIRDGIKVAPLPWSSRKSN